MLILNLEWSPETTLQAEDRCHRPGQTREVHVHYLLSSQTVDEQMYDLVDQKWLKLKQRLMWAGMKYLKEFNQLNQQEVKAEALLMVNQPHP